MAVTVGELMDTLRSSLQSGIVSEEDEVLVRNPRISDEAMEAGSDGYVGLEEVLFTGEGTVRLLSEEDV